MSEEAWVEVESTFIFEFDFKTFSIGTTPYRLCRVQVWDFFGIVYYFLIIFIILIENFKISIFK